MRQNLGYEINYTEGKIIVSKNFLKEAGNVGTTAYSELVQIRKDYPDYRIEARQITKRQNKLTYGKLTYKYMQEYIETKEDKDQVLAEFERVQQLAKFQSAQYVFVKKWFLGLYGDEFKRENPDENQEKKSA